MKVTCLFFSFVTGCCLACFAQSSNAVAQTTNTWPDFKSSAFQSTGRTSTVTNTADEIRTWSSAPAATLVEQQPAPPAEARVYRAQNDFDPALLRHLERDGYFTGPRLESQNVFVRWTDAVFQPVPVRMRRTTVTCSVVTAVKKKNPFCLINPDILNISW